VYIIETTGNSAQW